jgi:adenylate cyclase
VNRRLAAILAADVVGFSLMMGRDEVGTLAALRDLRQGLIDPCIARSQGRVFKATGDGVLAEFPSVVNAVRCAVEIQQGLVLRNAALPTEQAMLMRIGVNLGDVIAERDDVLGDGVNLATRLEGIAPPGGIAVSATVRENVGTRLDLTFNDLGERALKNIAQPVRVFTVAAPSDPVLPGPLARREKPSIAVLPFTNMSGDAEQEFFSDGITEDIITELSRFRDLFVIARNSTFTYKGRAVNIRQVGRDLGAAYALEGSVRRAGNRVRITAQLIDTATGNHIWADRFDGGLEDVFQVQDEITRKIVGMLTLGLENDALDRARRKPPESLAAYEHWLRGKRLLWTDGQDNRQARQHFESAARIDPGFSRAWSGMAVTWQMEALGFWNSADWRPFYGRALECAEKALELDDADYQAHVVLAWPLLYLHDYNRMRKHIDRAIQLNPNDADTLGNATYLLGIYGDGAAAVACGEAAARLNPRFPDWYETFLSTALFAARRYEEAWVVRQKHPDYFIDSTFFGAAILARLGRLDEARAWGTRAAARLAERFGGAAHLPKSCVQMMMDNNPYRLPEDRAHFRDALLLAGLPA